MSHFESLPLLLLNYAFYFGGGVILLMLFAMIYMAITPYDEMALIRQGSGAAMLSFSGTMIGFSLTLAANAIYNTSFISFVTWGIVAMVVQILGYFAIVKIVGNVDEQIRMNNMAVAGLVGLTGLVLGIINAGCLS